MSWTWLTVAALAVAAAALEGLWYGKRAGGSDVSRWVKWSAGICLVAAIGLSTFWFFTGREGNAAGSAQSQPTHAAAVPVVPVVPVQVSPIRLSNIQETITVYGTVVVQPGETSVVSVPFESRVGRMFVTAGEQVRKDAPLLEIGPSAASLLQLRQAKDAESTAQKDLQQMQEQFNQRLATNTQLIAARQTFSSAHLNLDNLEKQGVGQSNQLKAHFAGIIRTVNAQEGQIVPAGGPLVEIAMENRIEVKLGIEPEDVSHVHENALVELAPVHTDGQPTAGHVRLITHQVNPATRLVDVFVTLPPDSGLMLEGYVRGTLVIASKKTLVVPRGAVLPEDKAYALYTVENGKAVKHVVHLGLENSKEVEVAGDNLHEGMAAVLSGNYELTPGMAVSQEKSP